ncbi:MAG TPA: hypothetical protein VHB25_10385 [Gemmatimonadaceae bacterium]|nr:hypothetical protein [Gemmatimonadaceae bacterium]
MRRISVVIFGTREALDRVQEVARAHDIQTLLVPPEPGDLAATIASALRRVS